MPRSIPIAFGASCRRLRARAWGAFPAIKTDFGTVRPRVVVCAGMLVNCFWGGLRNRACVCGPQPILMLPGFDGAQPRRHMFAALPLWRFTVWLAWRRGFCSSVSVQRIGCTGPGAGSVYFCMLSLAGDAIRLQTVSSWGRGWRVLGWVGRRAPMVAHDLWWGDDVSLYRGVPIVLGECPADSYVYDVPDA